VKTTSPEPEIVTCRGEQVSGILPIANYEELLERVEDAKDVAWLKHARKKPQLYRALEDYLAECRAMTGHATEQGIAKEKALKKGMEAKLKESVETGAKVNAKA
jgi:hypothetical protein